MIIYITTNMINGKIYVVQDTNDNDNYYGSGWILKAAIAKYGKENFKKEIIEYCKSKEELNEREIYWIEKLSPQYNIAKGGQGRNDVTGKRQQRDFMNTNNPFKGKRHTTAVKKYLSEKMKKWWKKKGSQLTEEERKTLYGHQKNKGKSFTQHRKDNISKAKRRYEYIIFNDEQTIHFWWKDLKQVCVQEQLSYSYMRMLLTVRYKKDLKYKNFTIRRNKLT